MKEEIEMRDIPNYEGLYAVTRDGRVFSYGKNKFLKPGIDTSGYFRVILCKNNKNNAFLIHRLVAMTFLPNSNNLPIVNHKDENPSNNCVENLEWCTQKYNSNYRNHNLKLAMAKGMSITCVETGVRYISMAEVRKKTKIRPEEIKGCCNGKAGGYTWKWTEMVQEELPIEKIKTISSVEEITKDIPGYEGLYAITNKGKVFSYGRNKFLKQSIRCGYFSVSLCKNGKAKKFQVHRLVAMTFIPNSDNLPLINHKDENRLNNCVENLEWCTNEYNSNYGNSTFKMSIAKGTPVFCVETGVKYTSAYEAYRKTGINYQEIKGCCNGTAGGYHWQWAE